MPATLKSRLPAIAASLRPRVSAAIKIGAEGIARDASERVAVGPDPHHIRDDIYVERTGPAEYAVIAGREETFYGHILEHGGATSSPRPFLIPAAEAGEKQTVAAVTTVLRRL